MADVVITDQNFQQEVLTSDTPVLVDFWAPWCGPCKLVAPIVEDIAKEYEGKLKVGKMNVDENQTAGQFGIMSIPTLMIFKNGQPVESVVGAQSKDAIKQHVEKALNA
jgi:thioredoxin 1